MKVTYLYHSGFLVEWKNCCFLFDYIRGELPQQAMGKPFFVFCSHSHGDHFTPEIFEKFRGKPDTCFVLAKQIDLRPSRLDKWGLPLWQREKIVRMKAGETLQCADPEGKPVEISTLASTDMGVAFLVRYEGKCLYHAGDLNDWQWKGEPEEWNRNMRQRFLAQMKKLKDLPIDLAFAPLDPRQEEMAPCGLNTLLTTARVEKVLPMHMWDRYEIGAWWKKEGGLPEQADKLLEIQREGQQFEL